MKLHRFNEAGISRFRGYLADLRQKPSLPPPWEMLEDAALTTVVPEAIELERPGFALKRDAAVYLHAKLKPFMGQNLFKDSGLWTWLSLYYFDDVCPAVGAVRAPANDAHYVLEADEAWRYYKHLLATPVRI